MNGKENCEQLSELAPAYALGAVSTSERLAFKAHVDECPLCARELASYERVVGSLSLAAEQETPRLWVRERLLNYLGPGYRQTSSSFGSRRSVRLLPWAMAASLTVLSLTGLFGWRAATQNAAALSEELAAVRGQAFALQVSLQSETEKSRDRELAIRAMNDPSATVVALEGMGPIEGPVGRIHCDQQNRVWAVTTNLPTPEKGKVYQLWFITADQRKISAGLVKPYSSDCGFMVVRVPTDLNGLVAAAITLEREGGSEQPTMPVYAAGKLSL
jgi:anti-sigma-K factor RskA